VRQMIPKSYKGLKKQFDLLPEETKGYLAKLEPLLQDGTNFEIALAYCFMKLEEGHHRALKCGLIRIHECDSAKTDEILDKQHLTNEVFVSIFKNVFGGAIPNEATEFLQKAQKIRNRQIHGKNTTNAERREGIHFSLKYMEKLGEYVRKKTDKNPYGDLRGLKGKKLLLASRSTIWMLKGFGLGT
jgi:hypothetical protein